MILDTSSNDFTGYPAWKNIYQVNRKHVIYKWVWVLLGIGILALFLPWTQNVQGNGSVTTMQQDQRPQQVNAIIGGAIEKWYLSEGAMVSKGDTILKLAEVKTEYFDPELLDRTRTQINAKQRTRESYQGKAATSLNQVSALQEARQLKLESLDNKIRQQQLKVNSNTADLEAVKNEQSAYQRQINAARVLLDSGAISLTEFEKRKINFQNSYAKVNSATNKLQESQQELANIYIEKQSTLQEYADKIAKASGENFGSLSEAATTDAEIAKLEGQYQNYNARINQYYVIAPQAGQITRANKAGLGEVVKEGELIVEIVPVTKTYAVEMYVDAVDLPLLKQGQNVRFSFDGFPAVVFSGWPKTSYGTFPGKIAVVENNISPNGKFRILVEEDKQQREWPPSLRIGGGARGIALLKTVPIFYELWRNINGFPKEFYAKNDVPKTEKK